MNAPRLCTDPMMRLEPVAPDLETLVVSVLEALKIGDSAEAHGRLQTVARREGDSPLALHLTGLLALRLQEPGRALGAFNAAHAARPEIREFAATLSVVHAQLGHLVDSLYFQKLVIAAQAEIGIPGLVPDWLGNFRDAFLKIPERPLLRFAEASLAKGDAGLAAKMFQRDIEVDRGSVEGWRGLATALVQAGRPLAALQASTALLSLEAHGAADLALHAEILADCGRFDDALAVMNQVDETHGDDPRLAFKRVTILARQPGDSAGLPTAIREWSERFKSDPSPATAPNKVEGRRLRVGVVTSRWAVGDGLDLIVPTLAALPRDRIELIVYGEGATELPLARILRTRADTWHDWSDVDSETAIFLVRNERPDVLIDLDGPIRGSRPEFFLARPASRSLSLYGYPGVSSHLGFDATLLDDSAGFEAAADVIRVPGGLASAPNDLPPIATLARAYTGAEDTGATVTFGTLSPGWAISAATLALWRRILLDLPEARLCLDPEPLGGLEIAEQIIANLPEGQIVIRGHGAEEPAYLDRVDVLLDPLDQPMSDANLLASMRGTPLVSLAGLKPRSSLPTAWYGSVGLADLVARDLDSYRSLAMELTQPARRARFRERLRGAIESDKGSGAAERAGRLAAALLAFVERGIHG